MKNSSLILLLTALTSAPFGCAQAAEQQSEKVALSTLDLSRGVQIWGVPRADLSVNKTPLRIAGQEYKSGFGTHASSQLFVRLGGHAGRFRALVGADDGAPAVGSVEFKVIGDGKTLWQSGVMRKGDKAKALDVDVTGVQYLTLAVEDADDGLASDHANWVDAGFEGVNGPIEVVEKLPQHAGLIVSGAAWRDTKGDLIQAHGGGILRHQGKFYWYGEDRSNGYVGIGVSAYVSDDLVNWKPLGVVMPKSAYDEKWKDQNINERPKVIYNPRTKKFVMWFHYDRSGYGDSRAGVAIADRPEGPFQFLGALRPVEKSTYRDQTVFVDDDGRAYSIASGDENYTMYIVRLNDEWTAPQQPMVEGQNWARVLVREHREAPAVFKHDGKYYMINSGATGWSPNAGRYAVADSMLGPWKTVANPFVGTASDISFGSQSTDVLPLGGNRFIYMGDRWNPADLRDSRYVWLPFEVKAGEKIEIPWRASWKPELTPTATATTPAADAPMRYRLGGGSETWPADKRERVVKAMDEAIALYNSLGVFPKQVTASYNPGTPTADGNFNGNIRFGGQIGTRVALHELGHVMGAGTTSQWGKHIKDGLWTGQNAIAQLREFDGPGAILHADRQHFWPYGLNFDTEDSAENRRRHVLMVAALRADMGLNGDVPFVLTKGKNSIAPPTLAVPNS